MSFGKFENVEMTKQNFELFDCENQAFLYLCKTTYKL